MLFSERGGADPAVEGSASKNFEAVMVGWGVTRNHNNTL